MKIRTILSLAFITITLHTSAQNVGIGTNTPNTKLEVEGITRTDTLQIKDGSNRINSSANGILQLQSNQHINLDPGFEGSANNSVFISANDINYVKFDGATNRMGMGTNTPLEKIDINGAIKLQSTANDNEGTIQWDGSDFTGYDGSDWNSLTKTSQLIDADGDSEIELVEAANDQLNLTLNNKLAMRITNDLSGSNFTYFSDPLLGESDNIYHKYNLGSELIGLISVNQSSPNFFSIQGDERVYITGGLNLDSANRTNVSIGNHFGVNGMIINTGSAPIGSARALLDVKGKIESDGATFNDVINLTPMVKPLTAIAGDVYMDDGSCGPCNGFVRLRYYTGNNWVTLN